ncbi:hypothetical protein ACOMHN_029313 [Nucella lapillus]
MHRKMLSVQGKGYAKIYSENPFHEDLQPKAFYHPTQEKALSKEEKQLSLSPKRADGRTRQDEEVLAERRFLAGSHAIRPLTSVQTHLPHSPNSSDFDESWPDSERPSSLSMAGEDGKGETSLPYASVRKHVQPAFTSHPVGLDRPSIHTGGSLRDTAARERLMGVERTKVQLEREEGRRKGKGTEIGGKESVLQRYIERFRHGAPTSREERVRQEGKQTDDFWWLDSGGLPLPTPTSTSTPKEEEGRSVSLTGQGKRTLTVENVRKQDDLDLSTRRLQERAERVLHSAGSMTSSGPVVSTEGLGSTGSDVTGSSFSEAAVRPAFLPRESGPGYPRPDRQPLGKGVSGAATPQEDILYKWRLQRKLEAARLAPDLHLPSDAARERPPKTSAEKDIERRLTSFRDSLLDCGSVVKTHLLQARVEKDMKQVQSMMDTAVQTSPAKSPPPPSSLFPHVHHPQSWSGGACTGQTGRKIPDIPPPGQLSRAPQAHGQTEHPASSENRGIYPSQGTAAGKREVSSSGDVQYRQFLEAEKPQDVANAMAVTQPTPAPIPTPRSSSSSSSMAAGMDGGSTADAQSAHVVQPGFPRSSRRADRDKKREHSEAVIRHDGGDGAFTEVKTQGLPRKEHGSFKHPDKLADGGDMSELVDDDNNNKGGDSDGSSARSDSRRKGRKERDRQTMKPAKSGTEGGEELSGEECLAPQSGVSRRKDQARKVGEGSSHHAQGDRHTPTREDPEGTRASTLPHRRPPTDAGTGSRSGVERSHRSGVMPPPQSSSSPARTPLTSAIGQVVQDRLFDMSVSVLSSVDSVSSLHPSVGTSSPLPPPSRHASSAPVESDVDSDGEFESDPLLAVLRQQRERHETQLRCLDSILAERGVL